MKIFLVFLILCSGIAAAPLTLTDALVRVDAGHPWLHTRAALTSAAEARDTLANVGPPLEFSVQLENALGTGEFRAARSLETTLQFSRALDWADRRAARRAATNAQSEAERTEWEERRRVLLAETTRRFIFVVAAQAALETAAQQVALSQQTVDTVRTRLAKAAATPGELARAKLAHTELAIAHEHTEHDLAAARRNLATLWGATTTDSDVAAANLGELPDAAPFEVLAERLAKSPAQARFAALLRWRHAEETLALTQGARGDKRWSAGLRRAEASDDFGFVLGFDYAWPTKEAPRAHAAISRAERDRVAAEKESALLAAHATLYALCQELNQARIEYAATRDELLPATREWITSIEAGITAGRYELRELLEARSAFFVAQRRQTQAAADYHLTLVAIEQLLGESANR